MKKFLFIAAFIVSSVGIAAVAQPAEAAYNSNNLMSDAIFTDKNSMNVSQIQSFLNARNSGLRNYTQNGRTAAQIIHKAAQDYGVNPRVIMATLQKEQSLMTNPNPGEIALRSAMGYACPTNGTCEERFRGFTNQVDNGVWQLRLNYERARGNNSWWNPAIGYACGGSTHFYSPGLRPGNRVTFRDGNGYAYATITIANAATAALYCYTPHVYNPSGNGQYYSGSYNFVNFYERWWGPTTGQVATTTNIIVAKDKAGQAFTDTNINVQYKVKNHTNRSVDVGQVGVGVRGPSGENLDLPLRRVNLGPWQTITYSHTFRASQEGVYRFFKTTLKDGQWRNDYPPGLHADTIHQTDQLLQRKPQLTQQPTVNQTDMRVGKNFTASFKIRNPSTVHTAKVGRVMMTVRGPSNLNRDLALHTVPDLAPGQEYTYTRPAAWTSAPGQHRMFVSSTQDNGSTWSATAFAPASGVNNEVNVQLKPSPTFVESVKFDERPRVGGAAQLSFAIKNYGDTAVNVGRVGLTVRSPSGQNRDPRWDNVTIPAGETYTYNAPVTFNEAGKWAVSYTSTRDNKTWSPAQPVVESSEVKKTLEVTPLSNPTVTEGVTLSKANPRVGERVTVTYKATNHSNQAVSLGTTGVAARDAKNGNADPGWESNVSIAPGATWTYSKEVVFREAGKARVWIVSQRNNQWVTNYPMSENNNIQRSIEVNVSPSPTVTEGVSVSGTPRVGQTSNISFQVRNYGSSGVTFSNIGVSLRGPAGQNRDPRWDNVTIPAGGTYTYTVPVTFNAPGRWVANIQSRPQNGNWTSALPASETTAIVRSLNIDVAP